MAETTENTSVRKNATLMISYSRKDLAFVRQLFEGLLAQGFAKEDIWVDWEGIPLTADWMAEITKGIQSANAFIFVISPDSLASEVCAKEIAIAVESNKRFVPILYREPGKGTTLHQKISSHNWVYMRDDPETQKSIPALVKALNTDLDWLAQHTRLLNRALEWERKDRNDSYLVRGTDLQEAQSFIELGAAGKEPSPTALHVEYVQAARKHAAVIRRRNRIITAVVGVILLVLTVFSVIQWIRAVISEEEAVVNLQMAQTQESNALTQEAIAVEAQAQAEKEARVANAQALAAEAFNQKDNDTQLALMLALLSIQETEQDHTVLPESKSALFASLNSPNVLYTIPQSNGIVWSVAYSPTGDRLAIGYENGVAQIMDAKSLRVVVELQFQDRVSGMDFSPDGRQLGVSSWDGNAKVFDVETGEESYALLGHNGAVNDIDFSPDGKLIATAGEDALVKLWHAENGSLSVTLPGHTAGVRSVDFGPFSDRLISGSDDDTAILWDIGTNSLLNRFRPDGFQTEDNQIESVAFNPYGNRIMTGGYQTVVVWNAIDYTEIHRLRGNQADVYAVAFAPDGLSMLTASSGIKIWDYYVGTERSNLSSHRGEVTAAAYSSDGRYILTGSWDNTVKLWSANLLIESLKLKQNVGRNLDANYSPDGKWIVATDESGNIILYDAQSGDVVNAWAVDTRVRTASFDPQNSDRLVTGDDNGQVIIWVAGNDEPALVINAHDDGIASTVFSPDGHTILSASFDGRAKVLDAESGSQLLVLDNQDDLPIYDAQFSDDGTRIVTASENNTAQIWNASSGEKLTQLKGHTDYILTALFSHDGSYVYTGSYDNTIRKWDSKTGELLQTLAGHTGKVNDLDVSSDDALLVSASADTTVKVWDLKTSKEIFSYLGNNEDANSVAFNADGTRVLTASSDETTKEFTIDYQKLLEVSQQYELRPLTPEECEVFLGRDNCTLRLFGGGAANPLTTPAPEAQATTASIEQPAPTNMPTEAPAVTNVGVTETAEGQALPSNESFYTEEFDGSLETWNSTMTSGLESQVSMSLDNGVLAVQLSPHEDKIPWVHIINDAFTYTDVQVDAVVTNNGNNANGVSLVCRYSDAGWYEFWVSNAQLYAIYAYDALGRVQQGYFELAAGGSPAVKAGHTANEYAAVCSGNELTLLVNDTVVKSIADTRYNFTEGKIGIAVSSPQTLPVDVQIESVTVSEP